MNCLIYYLDGFIKKAALTQPVFTIGRGPENSLILDEELLSRNHLRIDVAADKITITDLDSTNGTYVSNRAIQQADIHFGESFHIGGIEFFLKDAEIEDFKLSDELKPIFNGIKEDHIQHFMQLKTKEVKDVYTQQLKEVLKSGLKQRSIAGFLSELSGLLNSNGSMGSFFIIRKNAVDFDLLLSVHQDKSSIQLLKELVDTNGEIYNSTFPSQKLNSGANYSSYPFLLQNREACFIGIHPAVQHNNIVFDHFFSSLAKSVECVTQVLKDETPASKERPELVKPETNIVCSSPQMKEILEQAEKLSTGNINILICGESGTGKELIARYIHDHSDRSTGAFIALNCAAIPENLLEAELFGYEKGAFTGAERQKKGKLELASGGSLVLDEIGDMPMILQSKLLRVIQEQELYRLGGTQAIKVDLRILSMTNKDLKMMIAEDWFREDLYYRLVHHMISIPPLRERTEDIVPLVNFFTRKFCIEANKSLKGFSVRAHELLSAYRWPGNVRQLENEIRRVVHLSDENDTINDTLFSPDIQGLNSNRIPENRVTEHKTDEKTELLDLLNDCKWNKAEAARRLGISYVGLYKKLKRLGISRPNP